MWFDLLPMFTSNDKEKISLTNTRYKTGVKTLSQDPNSIHLNSFLSQITNTREISYFFNLFATLTSFRKQRIKSNALVAILDYVEQIQKTRQRTLASKKKKKNPLVDNPGFEEPWCSAPLTPIRESHFIVSSCSPQQETIVNVVKETTVKINY